MVQGSRCECGSGLTLREGCAKAATGWAERVQACPCRVGGRHWRGGACGECEGQDQQRDLKETKQLNDFIIQHMPRFVDGRALLPCTRHWWCFRNAQLLMWSRQLMSKQEAGGWRLEHSPDFFKRA